MPLPDINLDDRNFDQLFQEARRRISVYTPEWTDHNESDPGITMLQLFAWLQEMILYRLNKVPQKNFVKFLELVGMDLNQPAPAKVDLTFTLSTKDLPDAVEIPAGTRVTLGDAGDGPPVIFETDETLLAVGGELKAIQSFDAARFELRQLGQPFSAFGKSPQQESAMYLGFDRPFPKGGDQHRLRILAQPLATPFVQSSANQALATPPPPVIGQWEYLDTQGWQPLNVKQDQTLALTQTGFVIFQSPDSMQLSQYGVLKKPSDPPLYWLRFRIVEVLGPGYETAPMLEDVLLNTVSATNAITEQDEILGASNGGPNQTFQLSRYPVFPMDDPQAIGRIAVMEEEDQWEVWKEVKDFANSGRNDKHYTLNATTGVVAFGDGINGKIPRWLAGNADNNQQADQRNIRATSYKWGGGSRANAGANKITSLQSAVPYVQSVTNLRPSVGGEDEETVAHAEERAPMTLRTANRAVTPEDFSFLARQTPGARIRRAQAFPLHHPQFRLRRVTPLPPATPETEPAPKCSETRQSPLVTPPPSTCACATQTSALGSQVQTEVPMPGVLTVVVVPDSTAANPLPSTGTLQLVSDWLDKHRLLTAEVYVTGPRYREIHIKARVIADPKADKGRLEKALENKLGAYFHPLTGGSDRSGWQFGGTVYFSETYRQILTTPGVLRIDTDSVRTYIDSLLQPPCKDIELEPDELIYSKDHQIEVTYA
jgi:predicted phage baseplate assembly protein